jgi:hypothetical protein
MGRRKRCPFTFCVTPFPFLGGWAFGFGNSYALRGSAMDSSTTVVAWIGAVSGVSALLWDVYKWATVGPRLTVSVSTGMVKLNNLGRNAGQEFMAIRVRNTGTTATTLTTLSFVTYESWWRRRRLKWTQGGVVIEPFTKRPLPHKLDVGEEWGCTVVQEGRISELLSTGNMWCDVYHSWSKVPARGRAKPKP